MVVKLKKIIITNRLIEEIIDRLVDNENNP